MLTLDESEGHCAILAAGFRLAFRWSGDRWSHSLDLGDGPEPTPVAASLEGEADPTRVVSPSFQQIHVQRSPDSPEALRAFLVGQSGPHHFSAVFSVSEEEDGAVCVAVEVADRCRAEVVALASTYVVDLPTSNLRDAGPSTVSWDCSPAPRGSLSLEASAPSRIDLREAGRRAVHVQAACGVDPQKSTQSWSYTWRVRVTP